MSSSRTLVTSSHELEFPELKKKLWGGHLWNPSYFVSTVSENTEAQVKKYIENQNAESV
ncbi:transposase [Nostoc sp.]|uniref:transposase n=1 Tax=Nostoc sp. TaxID=1180 RepID=UPI003FA5DDBB